MTLPVHEDWSPKTAGRNLDPARSRPQDPKLHQPRHAYSQPSHEIRLHVRGALNNGVTKEELMEAHAVRHLLRHSRRDGSDASPQKHSEIERGK